MPGQNIVDVEEVPTQDIMNILDFDQETGIFDESDCSSSREYMDTEEEIEMAIDEAIELNRNADDKMNEKDDPSIMSGP